MLWHSEFGHRNRSDINTLQCFPSVDKLNLAIY